MSEVAISIDKAKKDKLFYVVANFVIVNAAEKTCLLLKRSETETVFPGKWAFPGGKLEYGDIEKYLAESGNAPQDGIDNILGLLAVRETKQECGLDVSGDNPTIIKNKVFIRPDNVPVMMVTMTAQYEGGEVELTESAIADFAWVTCDQLPDYDCIDGVRQEAEAALHQLG